MLDPTSDELRLVTSSAKKYIPVVIGLLQKQQQFLIAKRPEHVILAGFWEFPGGKIEAQETQKQALTREFQEEIGIHVTHAEFLIQLMNEFPDRTIELNVWNIHTYQGTPIGNEGQEICFASLDQFASFEFLPSNQKLIHYLKQHYFAAGRTP